MTPYSRSDDLKRAVVFDLDDTLYPERDFAIESLDELAGVLERHSSGAGARAVYAAGSV
jgi:phosphoserine phosphatase